MEFACKQKTLTTIIHPLTEHGREVGRLALLVWRGHESAASHDAS
jgi:hypothetical protein